MNHIPRNFNHLLVETVTHGNVGLNHRLIVMKDEFGRYIGTDMQTEKEWAVKSTSVMQIG